MSCAIYPVIISPDDDWYVVYVPDFDRGTQGEDMAEAIFMARDLIGLMGITYENDGMPIPEPSTTEPAHEPGDMIAWVDVDFKKYRLMQDQRSVRVNVTIPQYLKTLGEEAGINFSRELQERLAEKLAV